MLETLITELRRLQEASAAGMRVGPYERQTLLALFAEHSGAVGAAIESQLKFVELTGASYSPILATMVSHFDFELNLQHTINRGLAPTRWTSLLIRWLPWLSLVVSQAIGLSVLAFLLFKPVGWCLLAVSSVLSVAATFATRRILKRVRTVPADPGLWLELFAGALRQGIGVNRCVLALRTVVGNRVVTVEGELAAALSRGGPIAPQLEVAAAKLRRELRQSTELEVDKLPFRLLLPLGGLLVPQFVLLLVAPMVLAALLTAQNR